MLKKTIMLLLQPHFKKLTEKTWALLENLKTWVF